MYSLSPAYLNMTRDQQSNFRNVLKSFYKSALYDAEEFEEFESGLKKINSDKYSEETVLNLTKYISSYIKKHDDQFNKFLFQSKSLKTTSKILAVLFAKDTYLAKDLKQGGRQNFINFIELTIAEALTQDNSLKVALQFEKQETMKSIREMQYFRHFAPDQLLR